MRQKRFQGSHLSNDEQAAAVTKLVAEGKVDPCLSQTYGFDDIPQCHQLMLDNKHPYGNMGVLVNAPKPGLGAVLIARGAPVSTSEGRRAGPATGRPSTCEHARADGRHLAAPDGGDGGQRSRPRRPPLRTSSRFLIVGVRSEISLRPSASSASAGVSQRSVDDLVAVDDRLLLGRRDGGEEARVEADRLLLGRDPVGEVAEPVGGQREPLGAQHVEERAGWPPGRRRGRPRSASRLSG